MKLNKTYGEERPVYFVIAEGGEAPTFKHKSRISASKEAQRLARQNPDRTFHVVKLKESFVAEKMASNKREGMVGGDTSAAPSIGDLLKNIAFDVITSTLFDSIREGSRDRRAEAKEENAEFDMGSDDLTPEESAEDAESLLSAYKRAEGYVKGGDVIVVGRVSPLPGLLPHQLVRGVFLGLTEEDTRYAMVRFNVSDDPEDGTTERRVNISRLFDERDEEMRDMLGLFEEA